MMDAHQPDSRPIDIPEVIPNPAVPQQAPTRPPGQKEPIKEPVPANSMAT